MSVVAHVHPTEARVTKHDSTQTQVTVLSFSTDEIKSPGIKLKSRASTIVIFLTPAGRAALAALLNDDNGSDEWTGLKP